MSGWSGPIIFCLAMVVVLLLVLPDRSRCRFHAVPDGQGGYFLYDCKRVEAKP